MDRREDVTHTHPAALCFSIFFSRGGKQHSRLRHASAVWNTAQRTLNPATTQRRVHVIKRDVLSVIHSFISPDKEVTLVCLWPRRPINISLVCGVIPVELFKAILLKEGKS